MIKLSDPIKPAHSRVLLWGLIGSVLAGAFLGIVFILRNTWGWFEIQVMLTTVTVAVASLAGLACDLSRTPRGHNLLPRSGRILVIVSAAMTLVGIWGEIDSEAFWKVEACFSIFGVATVHVCLLSIAKLAKRFRWILLIGNQVIFGFALLLCSMLVGEIDSTSLWRLVAAISIAISAFTLAIPILHRISKLDREGEEFSTPIQQHNLDTIENEIGRLQIRLAELQRIRQQLQP